MKLNDKRTRMHLRSLRGLSTLGILFLIAFWSGTITGGKTLEERLQGTIVPTPTVSLEIEAVLPTQIVTPTPTPKNDEQKIREYLTTYGSPMVGYAGYYVKMGTKYGVDPKIMVAISVTESSAGKKLCHGEKDGHNAHGLLYRKRWTDGKITRECIAFGSYEQEIEYVAKLLSGNTYKGLKTIAQIGTKYDPENPAWVKSTEKVYNLINR